jgi:hypothetical protein
VAQARRGQWNMRLAAFRFPLLVTHESGHSVADYEDQHQRQRASENHHAQRRNLIEGEPTFAAGGNSNITFLPLNDGVKARWKVT